MRQQSVVSAMPVAGVGELPQVTLLMKSYKDAIESCGSLPRFSVLLGIKTLLLSYGWMLSVIAAVYILLVDIPYWIVQKYILQRQPTFIGSRIYLFIAMPFSSAARGNLSAFRIICVRYFSRLWVLLHAESRMNMIRREINYRNMDNAASARFGMKGMDDIEHARRMFDLFEQITRDRYRITGLIVLGPLLSIMSLATQKFILPVIKATANLSLEAGVSHSSWYGSIEFAVILCAVYALWIAGSAFYDKRQVLQNLDIYNVENTVFATLGIRKPKEFPIDICIFFLISLLVLGGFEMHPQYIYPQHIYPMVRDPEFASMISGFRVEGGISLSIPCVLALLALGHRFRSVR